MPPVLRSYSAALKAMPDSTIQRVIEGLPSLADIPAEIRFKIYNEINEARLVEIRYDETLETVTSPTKVPKGLQICRESRREAKRRYELCFTGRDGEAHTYFDFSCDVLYFGKYCLNVDIEALSFLAVHFESEEARNVKHLAVHHELMQYLSEQLAVDVEVLENEGADLWEAHLVLLPEFHHLRLLSVVGDHRGFITDEAYAMYEEMCERARDEELGNWRMPQIGYIIGELRDHELAVAPEKGGDGEAEGEGVGDGMAANDDDEVSDDVDTSDEDEVINSHDSSEVISSHDDDSQVIKSGADDSQADSSNAVEVIEILHDDEDIMALNTASASQAVALTA